MLTLLTVGIVTAITQVAEAQNTNKAYCGPDDNDPSTLRKCTFERKDCESINGKGECEKLKLK